MRVFSSSPLSLAVSLWIYFILSSTVTALPQSSSHVTSRYNATIPLSRGSIGAFTCGTPPPPDHVLNVHDRLHTAYLARQHYNNTVSLGTAKVDSSVYARGGYIPVHSLKAGSPNPFPPNGAAQSPQINTYIHIITTKALADTVTSEMVVEQFTLLKDVYHGQGFDFVLRNYSFVVNDTWATDGDDVGMKAALRKGLYRDYNLFVLSSLSKDSLGYCTVAYEVKSGMDFSRDGCNVAAGTLPGGSVQGYNQGGTAVHETGHWLGLMHTFEGNNCDGKGDYVEDTRVEKDATNGCPVGKNTCPDAKANGTDPIHNYMDYSLDTCYEGFTDGQRTRMKDMWHHYRASAT